MPPQMGAHRGSATFSVGVSPAGAQVPLHGLRFFAASSRPRRSVRAPTRPAPPGRRRARRSQSEPQRPDRQLAGAMLGFARHQLSTLNPRLIATATDESKEEEAHPAGDERTQGQDPNGDVAATG